MKLTAKVKLLPTDEQRELLLQTMEAANQAANYVSDVAWQQKTFGRVPVHRLTYYAVREQFGLSAQMAVRVIGKVVDAYTSQTCPVCGCVDKRNRPAQSVFSCVGCGYAGLADHIAALNIQRRAVVNLPNVGAAWQLLTSPRL